MREHRGSQSLGWWRCRGGVEYPNYIPLPVCDPLRRSGRRRHLCLCKTRVESVHAQWQQIGWMAARACRQCLGERKRGSGGHKKRGF
ncbi:hypothetical protein RRG08_004773 [Elysia crispata]|uniref:Uncharacterized protein n=1 Tax=Elysia crispata TaxID=231223 RepID=A0AAE1AIW3_9GAST|nr:hypothetical protein RRG08_004773 [Elysia crispata]